MLKSREAQTAQPMTDFFFAILAAEFGFVVVELAVSTLTWVFMRRFGAFVSSIYNFILNQKLLLELFSSNSRLRDKL